MKFALFIYEDETAYGPEEDGKLLRDHIARHQAFAHGLGERRVGGAGLRPTATATTVRTAGGGQHVHDGPFAEAKEQLGGFYLIDVPDLDAALAIAREVPLIGDGSIEVRPLIDE